MVAPEVAGSTQATDRTTAAQILQIDRIISRLSRAGKAITAAKGEMMVSLSMSHPVAHAFGTLLVAINVIRDAETRLNEVIDAYEAEAERLQDQPS